MAAILSAAEGSTLAPQVLLFLSTASAMLSK
jgi:hypothetical protein